MPGDVVHLRQGTIVPADVQAGGRLAPGGPIRSDRRIGGGDAEPGKTAYAGAMVRGGEATGEVTATGAHTFFGRTAELVRTAGSANRQEHEIVAVVKNLFVVNAAMVVLVVGYAHHAGMSIEYILPLLLAILLASIPVALPATFTLAAALGSVELSKRGVLITRLSALHDIASMTVLCSDKTGTLTRNEATVNTLWPAPGFSETDFCAPPPWPATPPARIPWMAPSSRPPLITAGKTARWTRLDFKPFDPATKRAEAVYRDGTARGALSKARLPRSQAGWRGGNRLAISGRTCRTAANACWAWRQERTGIALRGSAGIGRCCAHGFQGRGERHPRGRRPRGHGHGR